MTWTNNAFLALDPGHLIIILAVSRQPHLLHIFGHLLPISQFYFTPEEENKTHDSGGGDEENEKEIGEWIIIRFKGANGDDGQGDNNSATLANNCGWSDQRVFAKYELNV